MRFAFLVYGLLYVVMEMVGHHLERVGWAEITALDVATALTDAFLTVAICVAVLVAIDLLVRRWRRWMWAWEQEQLMLIEGYRDGQQPIGVASWRPAPSALPGPMPATSAAGSTYAGDPYARSSSGGQRYPQGPGRLL
jgi:hypothetical protein